MDYPVINVSKKYFEYLQEHCYGSAGPRPSVVGMRKHYWGDAPLVRCCQYVFRVSPSIYEDLKGRIANGD